MKKILIQFSIAVSVFTVSTSALADKLLWELVYKKEFAVAELRLKEIESTKIVADFTYAPQGELNTLELAAREGQWDLVRRMQDMNPQATREILTIAAAHGQNDIVDAYFLTTNPEQAETIIALLQHYRELIRNWPIADLRTLRGIITRELIGRQAFLNDTHQDRLLLVDILFPQGGRLMDRIAGFNIDLADRIGRPVVGIFTALGLVWVAKAASNIK